jgi:iron(III) transport system ATP-binding protein
MSDTPREAGTDARPYLRIANLTKKFGTFTALDSVSLDVFEGEFVCFLGPSGCGKTTFLRAIAGLDIQTSGTVEQDGRDISALPPAERDFGIVFQSYALFPNLTVAKNVAFGLENTGVSRAEITTRVADLLELVGLPEQGTKYPAQLSGGQQQRIALARAIAMSPGLLLLDEPLSALDAKVRVHLRHEIKELQRRLGVTTVMVTHDQEEALTMADRIVVMNQGVIDQVGTPIEIYRRPRTAFVADFIGTMNFMAGAVVDAGKVRVGSVPFECDVDGFSQGEDVTVAIRPENVVVREGQGEPDNPVEVMVGAMDFLGSFFRVELTAEGFGDEVLEADFSINLVRRTGVKSGDRITVSLPHDRIRIFPPRQAHG